MDLKITVVGLLAITTPISLAAAPVKSANAGGIPIAHVGAPVVLYSQLDAPFGNGAPDQDFEAAFNAYDSEAADDFVVTDPTGWNIEQITTVGTLSGGGNAAAATVDVNFFLNSTGGGDPDLPGLGVAGCQYSGIDPTETGGSFVITLPTPCALEAGTYWVSVQTNLDFATGGQHFWSNRTTQSGSESVWRNPGGGFATGCTTFTPQTICGVGGGGGSDFLFSLLGEVQGVSADLFIEKSDGVTTADAGGSVTYTILVGNAGLDDVVGATVTDTFPAACASVSWTCVPTAGATCTAGPVAGNINDVINLAVSEAATYTATCNLAPDAAGTLSNTATVSSSAIDPDPTDNSSTDEDAIGASTDLSILKTGLAPEAGVIEYTISVTNNGPSNATGVVVTDVLPAQVEYVSDTCGASNLPPWTWNVGNLAASASVNCTVTVAVVTAGAIDNTATVTGAQTDPDPTDNSSIATVIGDESGSILEIPTLSAAGLTALAGLLALLAAFALRRRRA